MIPPDPTTIVTVRLLLVVAHRITESFLTFSGWLVGSFAALLALLLANLQDIANHIPASAIGDAASWFLIAVGIHALQRYIAAVVLGGVSAAKEMEALPPLNGVDFGRVMMNVEQSFFRPARFLMRRLFDKLRSGDFTAGARLHFKLAQFQGLLVLIQIVVIVKAGSIFACVL